MRAEIYYSSWPTPLWKVGTVAVCNPGEPVRKARKPASRLKLAGRANSTSSHLFVPLGPSASWTVWQCLHTGEAICFSQSSYSNARNTLTDTPRNTVWTGTWASSGPVKVKGKTAHHSTTLSRQETDLVGDTWELLPHKGEHNARGAERGECELISGVHPDDIKYTWAQNTLLRAK